MTMQKKTYDWIVTELKAGMVLNPVSEEDRLWNHATTRAISIVRKYQKGIGLFQLTNETVEKHIDHAPMNVPCSKCGRKYCDHENKY